ncbi:MAG: trigger factor [Planctomycetota bacterium]
MTETATQDRPALSVEIEDAGPARKRLAIEIPEDRIKGKIEENYDKLGDEAAIPGFRRGRAPRRLVERKFGKAIRDDVRGQLLSEAYTQACEDHELDVLGEPDVTNDKGEKEPPELPESGPMKFVVEVEVTPEVELPEFGSLKVEKPSGEVTDEDVDKQVEMYRERFGQSTKVEGEAIAEGDYVTADVSVFAGSDAPADDAEPLAQGQGQYIRANGEDRDFKGHAMGIVVDGLGKELIGKTPAFSFTHAMTGPTSHENEDIRDKPITLKIDVSGIERLEPASIEEVAEQLHTGGVDELRTQLRTFLEQQAAGRQTQAMHEQLREQLLEKVTLDLPADLTGRQIERTLQRQQLELMYQGLPEEQVAERMAELRESSTETTQRQLKQFFILDRASKDLEIDVAENELNGRIAQIAMQQGRRPEKLRQEMMQRGEIEQVYLQIREHKTLDKILEQAEVADAAPDAGEAKTEKKAKKKSSKKKSKKAAAKDESKDDAAPADEG